ncbi:NAD(P)H-dependent oxidoreductase [Alteribacter lacisalsi]|uniref:NAD(P)H-dependent oxidoreductase n=1 Tax=Alteribacter lacisalsi TaxID=2045244 RepID=A0A2W0HH33_9BACI|nr:flavodoxin family protein [Alteribacter lacisalsi]PYZ96735.1 NAD(P)H-dependent oxidoreductase [Alteribacter lacisalsi]
MLVLYGSSRADGNSEQLAEKLIGNHKAERMYMREKRMADIEDRRHVPAGFEKKDDDYYEVLDRLMAHDTVIFVTPLYWYGMSGVMKRFVDRWSETLRDRKVPFRATMKEKTFYLVVTGGDNPKQKALPLVLQFQHICTFFGTEFGGYVIGEANEPGQIAGDREAMLLAEEMSGRL